MDDATKVLIDRLRDRDVCSLAHNSCRNDWQCETAADALENQADCIEELEAAMRIALNEAQYTKRILKAGHPAGALEHRLNLILDGMTSVLVQGESE